MDEIEFHAVDGLEAEDVIVHETVELARILVVEQDEVSGAEVVAHGVLCRVRLTFLRDWSLGFSAISSGCFVLLVSTHTFFRFRR